MTAYIFSTVLFVDDAERRSSDDGVFIDCVTEGMLRGMNEAPGDSVANDRRRQGRTLSHTAMFTAVAVVNSTELNQTHHTSLSGPPRC